MKVSLAAEREPLPVGIGEGGGASVVDRLTWLMTAMAAWRVISEMVESEWRSHSERVSGVVKVDDD